MSVPSRLVSDPFAHLDIEWARLCHRRSHTATVRHWAAEVAALADIAGLEDLITGDRSQRRLYFAAVVDLVRGDDELARRVMVQMLVPGLICITNQLAAMFTGVHRGDLAADVITAAWGQASALSTGRSSARTPGCILRNIRRDTIRWHRSLRPHRTGPDGAPGLDDGQADDELAARTLIGARTPGPSSGDVEVMECETRLVLTAAVRSGVLDERLAELIWQVVAEDRQFKQAASDVGLSEPWAYQLRARTAPALRAHLDAAA